jgi:hypothetical protein
MSSITVVLKPRPTSGGSVRTLIVQSSTTVAELRLLLPPSTGAISLLFLNPMPSERLGALLIFSKEPNTLVISV